MRRNVLFLLSILLLFPQDILRQNADAENRETGMDPDIFEGKEEVICPLSPHVPLDCKISSERNCTFQTSVDSGQFLHIILDHWGDDVNIAIFDPTGKKTENSFIA